MYRRNAKQKVAEQSCRVFGIHLKVARTIASKWGVSVDEVVAVAIGVLQTQIKEGKVVVVRPTQTRAGREYLKRGGR